MNELNRDFIDAVQRYVDDMVDISPEGTSFDSTKPNPKKGGKESDKLGKATNYMERSYVQYEAFNIVGLGSDFYERLYFSDEDKKEVVNGNKKSFIKHCLKQARIPSPIQGKETSFNLSEVTKAYMRLQGYACWDNHITKPEIPNYKAHKVTSKKRLIAFEADENMVRIHQDYYIDITLRDEMVTVPQHTPLPEAYIHNALYKDGDGTPVYIKEFILEALHAFSELKTEGAILAWGIKAPKTDY